MVWASVVLSVLMLLFSGLYFWISKPLAALSVLEYRHFKDLEDSFKDEDEDEDEDGDDDESSDEDDFFDDDEEDDDELEDRSL